MNFINKEFFEFDISSDTHFKTGELGFTVSIYEKGTPLRKDISHADFLTSFFVESSSYDPQIKEKILSDYIEKGFAGAFKRKTDGVWRINSLCYSKPILLVAIPFKGRVYNITTKNCDIVKTGISFGSSDYYTYKNKGYIWNDPKKTKYNTTKMEGKISLTRYRSALYLIVVYEKESECSITIETMTQIKDKKSTFIVRNDNIIFDTSDSKIGDNCYNEIYYPCYNGEMNKEEKIFTLKEEEKINQILKDTIDNKIHRIDENLIKI